MVLLDALQFAYATHRPSGENTAPVRIDEWIDRGFVTADERPALLAYLRKL